MNTKDLTGNRYGRLVVVERTDQRIGHCYLWRCRCDCGQEKLVRTYALTHGQSRSCGCLQRETRERDLTGLRFGRLLVVRPTGETHRHSRVWECRCDCGRSIEIRGSQLTGKSGTRSCGCLHSDTAASVSPLAHAAAFQDGTHPGRIASQELQRNNRSGVRGVCWHRGAGMWVARIHFQGVSHHLGYFSNLADAAQARREAEETYFETYLKTRQ